MIASRDEAKGLLISSLFFVDQGIQDSLYEALSTGQIDRDKFQELIETLTQWQRMSKKLLSVF